MNKRPQLRAASNWPLKEEDQGSGGVPENVQSETLMYCILVPVLENHPHRMLYLRGCSRGVEGLQTPPHTKIIVNNTRDEFPGALGADGRCTRVPCMFYGLKS